MGTKLLLGWLNLSKYVPESQKVNFAKIPITLKDYPKVSPEAIRYFVKINESKSSGEEAVKKIWSLNSEGQLQSSNPIGLDLLNSLQILPKGVHFMCGEKSWIKPRMAARIYKKILEWNIMEPETE